MKRSTFLGSLAAAAIGAGVAGCSGSEEETSPGGDSSWTLPESDPTATLSVVGILDKADGIDGVNEAFAKAHESVKINYQYVPFDDLNSVIDSRVTSKTGDPDVYWVDQPRVPALSARGYLEDLSPVFSGMTDGLDESTVESSTYDGKLWSLPLANSTQLLFYNLDLLEKAGVEPPSTNPDKRITWQQLKTDAEAVQQQVDGAYGLLFGQPNRYYQLQPLPFSAGGGPGASGDGNLTPDVANDGWVQAMEYYGSLFADGVSPRGISAEQTNSTFLAGDTAYFVQGNWMVPMLLDADFHWGAALHPVWEGGEPATPTGSWSIGINPFSKNKDACAVFLNWLAIEGESGYSKYRSFAELPANLAGKEAYLAGDAFTGSPGGKQSAEVIEYETANTAVPRVSTVGYIEFEEILGRAFSDIANGTEPKQALESAESQLQQAWEKYR